MTWRTLTVRGWPASTSSTSLSRWTAIGRRRFAALQDELGSALPRAAARCVRRLAEGPVGSVGRNIDGRIANVEAHSVWRRCPWATRLSRAFFGDRENHKEEEKCEGAILTDARVPPLGGATAGTPLERPPRASSSAVARCPPRPHLSNNHVPTSPELSLMRPASHCSMAAAGSPARFSSPANRDTFGSSSRSSKRLATRLQTCSQNALPLNGLRSSPPPSRLGIVRTKQKVSPVPTARLAEDRCNLPLVEARQL